MKIYYHGEDLGGCLRLRGKFDRENRAKSKNVKQKLRKLEQEISKLRTPTLIVEGDNDVQTLAACMEATIFESRGANAV